MNNEDIPVTIGSGNVFADLGFPNAEEEQLKARLALLIMGAIKRRGLSQARAAKLLGVAQPNVSNLARGHYEDFSIDRLLRFLKALGTDIRIVSETSDTAEHDLRKQRTQSQEPRAVLSTEESRAVEFHEQLCSVVASVWRDGLNIMLRGFDPIHGHVIEKEEETILIALLVHAWQTSYRAYDNALKGYYPQALNLLRAPIEDWLAYWYIRSFPEEYKRFVDQSLKAPQFNEMLQKVEAKHFQGQPTPVVKGWIKRLHKYSHVDGAGVLMAILPGNTKVNLVLGPDRNAETFEHCTVEGVFVVLELLEALDNLRKLFGLPGIAEIEGFQKQVDSLNAAMINAHVAEAANAR